MIKILAPSIYKNIKGKSEKLVYICLWAWLNIGWREMFFEVAKKFCFDYLGERPIEAPDGSIIKVPTWWDSEARKIHQLFVLNPAYYPNVYHDKGNVDILPKGYINEKKFLEKFGLARSTFLYALKNLIEENLLAIEKAGKEERVPFKENDYRKIRRLENDIKDRFGKSLDKGGLDDILIEFAENILGLQVYIEHKKKKNYYYHYHKKGTGRYFELKDPLIKIVQVPLNILTREDLTPAERLVGIELYIMKKKEKLSMKKKANKSYIYLGKNRITIENLAKRIEISKPIICKTLKKTCY